MIAGAEGMFGLDSWATGSQGDVSFEALITSATC